MKRSPIERFFEHVVQRNGGCWQWTGPAAGLMIDGKQVSPRKLSWSIIHATGQPVPSNLGTRCSTKDCIRPGHLRALTKAARRPGKRLAPATITAIRFQRIAQGTTLAKLAKKYGISVSGVSRIVNGNRRSSAA